MNHPTVLSKATTATTSTAAQERLGLWLGLIGVIAFGLTLPMTRLATGSVDAPQLSPW